MSETHQSANNIRLGISSGTPRVIFDTAGSSTQWEIDNNGGTFRIFNPSTVRFTIDSSGNVNATGNVCAANISCASDARLKQNIRPLSYGLKEVLSLRPVKWEWKDKKTTKQPNLGLTAQEVEGVLPELILRNVDTKGSLGLNYMGLIPVLVKGIQEQQAEITKQQKEIEELKIQVRRLRATSQRRRPMNK